MKLAGHTDTLGEQKATALEQYIERHIDGEPPYLRRLWRETNIYLLRGHMASGHLQGVLLKILVEIIRPRRILEIGTYTGYSALSMASGLGEGGLIDTYEINDELEDFTRPRIQASPWAKKVRFHIGDVLEALKDCQGEYDLVFLDGNKRQYPDYYRLSKQVLRPNGLILADNTLWDGHVLDSAYDHDPQTLGIRRFNDLAAADPEVERVILPLRDGLTLIRLKE